MESSGIDWVRVAMLAINITEKKAGLREMNELERERKKNKIYNRAIFLRQNLTRQPKSTTATIKMARNIMPLNYALFLETKKIW